MIRQKKSSSERSGGSNNNNERSKPTHRPQDNTRSHSDADQERLKRQQQLCSPIMPSASSEEDIDPELREGINNIMKLRDEYDKLEGTLRKLGVDPHRNLQCTDDEAYDEDEEDNLYEEEEEDDLLLENIEKSSGDRSLNNNNNSSDYYSCEDDLTPPIMRPSVLGNPIPSNIMGRLGQLDIVEEVDESLLSSDPGEEPPLPPPPSYPWVRMALPGGGIVSVPLQDTNQERLESPTDDTVGNTSRSNQADLLTVNAGEPVTHFNLDQLLEIVQSFQLDATMAGQEEGSGRDLQALVASEPSIVTSAVDLSGEVGASAEESGKVKCDNSVRTSLTVGGNKSTDKNEDQSNLREIHSCPSSPTETECSSGFSTLRRRSVTLTEKIRTNRDGSKTQVVRQYGCNTSSAAEANQTVTYQQNSFVYINGSEGKRGEDPSSPGASRGSQSYPSLLPITTSAATTMASNTSHAIPTSSTTLPRSHQQQQHSGIPGNSQYRGHIVRLNSIEPNTVMFSTREYPLLHDITVPEIIDELEKQFDDKLCDLQGVRLVGANVYICLSRKDSLNTLSTYGFYIRGISVKVVDITHDSVVICLTGVPHYITDSTVTMLVSTFGICIGEVERRFYKGVDTGERYVRLKPRSHTQIPDFVTVGGCKILIRVLNQDEVCLPFTLAESKSSSEESGDKATKTQQGASNNFRSKPGHCNGSVNSPSGVSGTCENSSSNTAQFSTFLGPRLSHRASDILTGDTPTSPKIGKSFRSRINVTTRSPPDALRTESGAYMSGELVDIPALSPPPYKAPSNADSTSSSSTITTSGKEGYTMNNGGGGGRSSSILAAKGSTDDLLGPYDNHNYHSMKPQVPSPTNNISSSLRKYTNKGLSKTDSSNSLNSQKNGDKRSSVNFEEPRGLRIPPSPPPARATGNASSKTVNGILRKGSGPGDEIVSPLRRSNKLECNNLNNNLGKSDTSRRNRKSKNDRSSTAATKSSKSRNSKLESVTESGTEDVIGDSSTLTRSSRSRSNSTKSNKGSSSEKTQKDLALTRDLPWCGCWGNGCL